jgi:uncharacterized membrane protein
MAAQEKGYLNAVSVIAQCGMSSSAGGILIEDLCLIMLAAALLSMMIGVDAGVTGR